jgi:hypothetical protein
MTNREREKYPIMTNEEVNMHWPNGSLGGCSVGWAQNGTLRFFNFESGDGNWMSRAFDYAAWLKKRGYTLPESYNYNPFDFIKSAGRLTDTGSWYNMEDLQAMESELSPKGVKRVQVQATSCPPSRDRKYPKQNADDIALT